MVFTPDKIRSQVSLLQDFLKEQVTGDYAYLDVPAYLNVGDWLIAAGAWQLLKELPYRCLKRASVRVFDYQLPEGCVILLQGGGNFGDLYPGANWFRNEVVKHFPNHKIVFLPQTLYYNDESRTLADAKVCATHPNLHICARDTRSYNLLKTHFANNHLYLLPDTALGLYGTLNTYGQRTHVPKRSLLLQRNDKENGSAWRVEATDVMDWTEILKEIHFMPFVSAYKAIFKVSKRFDSQAVRNVSDLFLCKCMYPVLVKRINRYFLRFDQIYTTRLHGLILASMLHMPLAWHDNSYGKLSEYVDTWFAPLNL